MNVGKKLQKIKFFLLILTVGMMLFSKVMAQLDTVTTQMVVTDPGAVISEKYFSIQGKQALVILANNVTVSKCLFKECNWAIVVNGAVGINIKEMIVELDYITEGFAVALNGTFVALRAYETTTIKANDSVEILSPVQGG